MINQSPYYKLLKKNYLFIIFILVVGCIFVYAMSVLYNNSHFDDVSKFDYTRERIFYIPVIMDAPPATTTKS